MDQEQAGAVLGPLKEPPDAFLLADAEWMAYVLPQSLHEEGLPKTVVDEPPVLDALSKALESPAFATVPTL